MHSRARELIETLGLAPHPEGGFYREIYRSGSTVRPLDDREERVSLTTIYFLLTAGQLSRWHRVRSDEVWHLYEGGPLEVLDLDHQRGAVRRHQLGAVGRDSQPVCIIPAGRWQAARSLGAYSLAGCTVGPGFDFADFTMMADEPSVPHDVATRWPDLRELI